jgi:hypothetical protein
MSTQRALAQIINDGAVIRIEKDGKILLVAKDQVKTIDTVHDNIVRIDIGEGPLKNVFLNYLEIGEPATSSADELRDAIKSMMMSDQYDGGRPVRWWRRKRGYPNQHPYQAWRYCNHSCNYQRKRN